jgi:nucleotide-binding universal stress UspA family protein
MQAGHDGSRPHGSTRHVLVPVDDSDACRRALDALAAGRAGSPPDEITLLHVLDPYPTALLESGGASDPEEERRQHEDLARKRRAWRDEAQDAVRPLLASAERRLAAAGLDGGRVHEAVVPTIPEDDVAQRVLEFARARGCDRIVVGRSEKPWLVELFSRHLGEALEHHGEDGDPRVTVID